MPTGEYNYSISAQGSDSHITVPQLIAWAKELEELLEKGAISEKDYVMAGVNLNATARKLTVRSHTSKVSAFSAA